MRELVTVSKALADEARIRMLKLLLEKDVCVCEMRAKVKVASSYETKRLYWCL